MSEKNNSVFRPVFQYDVDAITKRINEGEWVANLEALKPAVYPVGVQAQVSEAAMWLDGLTFGKEVVRTLIEQHRDNMIPPGEKFIGKKVDLDQLVYGMNLAMYYAIQSDLARYRLTGKTAKKFDLPEGVEFKIQD